MNEPLTPKATGVQINARRYDVTGSGAVFDTAKDWQARRAEQWTTQRTTRSAQHATCSREQTTCDAQQTRCNRRMAPSSTQRTTRDRRHTLQRRADDAVASQFGPTNFNNKYGTTKKFYRVLRSAAIAGTAEGVVRGHAACRR
jgi:hypothetical protein